MAPELHLECRLYPRITQAYRCDLESNHNRNNRVVGVNIKSERLKSAFCNYVCLFKDRLEKLVWIVTLIGCTVNMRREQSISETSEDVAVVFIVVFRQHCISKKHFSVSGIHLLFLCMPSSFLDCSRYYWEKIIRLWQILNAQQPY